MLKNGHQLRSRIARKLDADQFTGGKGPIRSHLIEASGSSKLGLYLLAVSPAAALSAERRVLARKNVTVETELGAVDLKLGLEGDQVINVAPEYESCARVAERSGVPLKDVYAAAMAAWRRREGR